MSQNAAQRRYTHVPSSLDVRLVIDNADIEQLFAAHYTPLARVIYRVVGDTALAEELASEAFWKLHRNRPHTNENLRGWLYRTGLRLALDSLRRRKRRSHYESLAPTPQALQNPVETLESKEAKSRVVCVLARLRAEQASALVLRGEGYSLAEIAGLLHFSPSSVGKILARANAAFRKEYVNLYGEL